MGVIEHTFCSKITPWPSNWYSTCIYRAALSTMVSMNSGSSNTPECQKNYTYIGHNIGQKSMYYKKNLISSALIGGLVEMDRVFP